MASHRRLRKTLLLIGGLVVALLAFVLLSPLWIPLALKPIAARFGVTFKESHRKGYSRLVITDVGFKDAKMTFAAGSVELVQPITYLWQRTTHGSSATEQILIRDWTLTLTPSKQNTEPPSALSMFRKTRKTTEKIQHSLTSANLQNGIINFGTNSVRVPTAVWNNGSVEGDLYVPRIRQTVNSRLNLANTNSVTIDAAIAGFQTKIHLVLTRESDALGLAADVNWRTNAATVMAHFGKDGFIPRSAEIDAPSINIPSSTIRLTNYHDVNAALAAKWNGTNFFFKLSAHADAPTNSAQSLSAELKATGDTNSVRLERFSFAAPWATADLSKNIELSFKGRLLSERAEFNLTADLSRQDFFAATGLVSGHVFLTRTTNRYPDAAFKVSAKELKVRQFTVKNTEAAGAFKWPVIKLDRFLINLPEGGTATAHGLVDLEKKLVENAAVDVAAVVPPGLLPDQIAIQEVAGVVTLNGPFRSLFHQGKLKVQRATIRNLTPLQIETEWKGEKLNFSAVSLTAAASNSVVTLAGAATLATNRSIVMINQFQLTTNGHPALSLTEPTEITVARHDTSRWQVVVAPLTLDGPGGNLSLFTSAVWPSAGTVSVEAKELRAHLFQDFLARPVADTRLNDLHLSGTWSNSPVAFSATGSASYNVPDAFPCIVRVNVSGGKHGVRFEEVTVASETQTLVAAQGTLPLIIDLSKPKRIAHLDLDAPIDFHAATKANDKFWNGLTNITKLKVDHPDIVLNVSGTLNKPAARISANVTRLDWLGAKRAIPHLSDVRIELGADRKQLRLETLNFKVEGQPVLVRAEMPIGDLTNDWKHIFDWRKASGRVVLAQAKVVPFIRYLPAVLGPSGTVDLDVKISPGARINGDLRLRDIETRPLGTIGTLHDLRADLKFTESLVQFTNVTGVLGGEPVGLSGFINFAQRAPNKLPLFDLNVAGRSVPLTRKPDLILRANIELNALNTPTNAQPVVSGLVDFNDSFFLGDLKMLLPGKVTKPRERPPYFSVEAEPFANWKVNVRLVGQDFLKVRTPLFRGSLSANWRIRGTLREPIALGEAKIESGQIQFPFSNLRMQQGFITMTSEDPFRPHIFATAASRTFGYDIQMTANGPADKPIIEFSSTPPLTSEQIVLMMTAGELPKRETTFSTEQRAGRLALFLGKSLLSKFTSDEGGAERLTITSGENVTEQGKQTYAIEYKITDDVSLVAEYDRFGALNAGVKWRVYSK